MYLFTDASPKAYGFVAYGVQNQKSCILYSKAKVAPMKKKSLPTLELLGVFLALKSLSFLLKAYSNVQNVYISVDAQVVLSWLLSGINRTNKNIFARNRLKDINLMINDIKEKYSINVNFKYVPSSENPADMLSRGLTLDKFQQNLEYWIKGPKWLRVTPIIWPTSDLNCLSERSKDIILSSVFHTTEENSQEDLVKRQKEIEKNKIGEGVDQPFISFTRFSEFSRLVTSASYVYRYLNKKDLSVHCAKLYLLKYMQKQAFSNELEYLLNPQNKKPPDLVRNLDLFLDKDGLIRSSEGRIGKCEVFTYEVLNPILLPKKHLLTNMIILDCHAQVKHLGLATTLRKIRMSGFWIPQARQVIKTQLQNNCYMCKRFNNLSFKYPKVTNLPKHRVNLVKPFKNTGIDYTGHVFIKDKDNKSQKMYMLIFTCLEIRAVHIELVPDMGTPAFVQAFIRFTSLYGVPTHVYSDNARTFTAGFNLIDHIRASKEYKDKFNLLDIKHVKIPLYSAWVGATWERMIKVIKWSLYKTIGRKRVDYFTLFTVLSDIQNAINSRPLTYRCSDDKGLEIITPNCFLHPNANSEIMFKPQDDVLWKKDPPTRSDIVETLEIREEMLDKFHESYYKDYLLSLRESCKDLHQVDFVNKVKVNDIVLIQSPSKPRPYWLLGRVIQLFPGNDKLVRSVQVKRGDGAIQTHSLKHLYPLELSLTHSYTPLEPEPEADFEGFEDNGISNLNSNQRNSNNSNLNSTNSVNSDINSNSNGVNQPSQRRPQRQAVLRGRGSDPNDPYSYY